MVEKMVAFLSIMVLCTTAYGWQVQQPESIDEKATHADSSKINVPGVNAFCITKKGQILAACGSGPGEIRLLNVDGKQVRTWKVDVKPESINITPQGDVLVAGIGKLYRFNTEGKLLASADSPHAEAMRESKQAMRKAAITQLQRRVNYQPTVDALKRMISQLEEKQAKGTITSQEETMLASLPNSLKIYEERLEAQKQQGDAKKPSEAQIARLVDSMMKSKMRIASISTDGDHTYIATSAAVGYGFEVWKMANDFTGGQKIVTGLSGCCGQMDVQCCKSGIYVAENSRHRVVCFDKDGKQRLTWGKRDRTGIDGFTSCCNPMNVTFNAAGDVFTAESNTGRIKRFSKDGKFLAYIGDVKLVPGCKNVSIAVSPQGDRVYMLDITRGSIIVMTEKPAAVTASNSGS